MDKIEVRHTGEDKIWVNETKIELINNNIIYVDAVGEPTSDIIQKHKEQYEILSKRITGKTNFLINLNKTGKNSPEARKEWKKIIEQPSTGKVAFLGIHPVAKVLAAFVIGVARKKDMRFFSSKEVALSWLSD